MLEQRVSNDPCSWCNVGAGTMGIEVIEQVPDLDAIFVPVGGAGLIAGVSLAMKTLRPNVNNIMIFPTLLNMVFEIIKIVGSSNWC